MDQHLTCSDHATPSRITCNLCVAKTLCEAFAVGEPCDHRVSACNLLDKLFIVFRKLRVCFIKNSDMWTSHKMTLTIVCKNLL